MALITIAKKPEPILEYEELNYNPALIVQNNRILIKSNQNALIFPGCTKVIDVGLKVWIPKGHVGLIIKNALYTGPNLQLDTEVIYDDEFGTWIILNVTNRGWLPIKITHNSKLADLLIVPRIECHIVNTEGQS